MRGLLAITVVLSFSATNLLSRIGGLSARPMRRALSLILSQPVRRKALQKLVRILIRLRSRPKPIANHRLSRSGIPSFGEAEALSKIQVFSQRSRFSRVVVRIEEIGAKSDDDEQTRLARQSSACWLSAEPGPEVDRREPRIRLDRYHRRIGEARQGKTRGARIPSDRKRLGHDLETITLSSTPAMALTRLRRRSDPPAPRSANSFWNAQKSLRSR